ARYANAAAVQGGAGAAVGREQLVLDRIVDHGMFKLAINLASDGYAEMRQATHEIGSSVDRVDDPDRARIATRAGFLRANGVVGIGVMDGIDNGCFGAFVGLGDIIVFAFALNVAG